MLGKLSRPSRVGVWTVAGVAIVVSVFPILWLLLLATRSPAQGLRLPPDLFIEPRFDVFAKVWSSSDFGSSFLNSLIITVLGVTIALLVGIPAAFKLSRIKSRSDGAIGLWLVAVYALPPFLFAIPMFVLYQDIGLFDTHLGLALMDQVLVLPLTIWLLTSFLDAIPAEIDEAAFLDGASRRQVLRYVHLPLLRPGIATAAILASIIIWNELALALTLTFSEDRKSVV